MIVILGDQDEGVWLHVTPLLTEEALVEEGEQE